MARPERVCVIGAGVSGLVCARDLARAGHEVVIVDKGRGPGGRISTRREGSWRFDHGAPGFRERSPDAEVGGWQDAGVAALWDGGAFAGTAGGTGRTPERGEGDRWWTGVGGMNAIAKALSAWAVEDGAVLLTSTRVRALEAGAGGAWRIVCDAGDAPGGVFDWVVTSAPAPQSRDLLAGVCPDLSDRAGEARMEPSWVVMAGFERSLGLDSVRARAHEQGDSEGVLAWIGREGSKPGRSEDREAWVAHATTAWTEANLGLEREDAAWLLARALRERLEQHAGDWDGAAPRVIRAHRWRSARSRTPARTDGLAFLLDEGCRVGACGDWCVPHGASDGVLSAVRSGRALASALRSRSSGRS